jgi:predicted ester cyclase
MSRAEENKSLVRHLIEEGLNQGNLDIADEYFTVDYCVHIPGRTDLPTGPAAFKKSIGMWRAAFPDFHMTIEELVAEGEFVANRFTTRGTHQAPLMGIPPTGKGMVVHGQELHRLSNGKVAETWVCDDVPSILVQLGVLPRPPLGGPPRRGGPGE